MNLRQLTTLLKKKQKLRLKLTFEEKKFVGGSTNKME
jgi:hypothetical protein